VRIYYKGYGFCEVIATIDGQYYIVKYPSGMLRIVAMRKVFNV